MGAAVAGAGGATGTAAGGHSEPEQALGADRVMMHPETTNALRTRECRGIEELFMTAPLMVAVMARANGCVNG